MKNFLIVIDTLLGLLALGGLTDIVLHRQKRDWIIIALNVGIWGCFLYVLYLIIGA